jgi:hypothetical protein
MIRDSRSPRWVSVAALAVLAYAAADAIHELAHALIALFLHIQILSISPVAIQTAYPSRAVAAAGTIADIAAGLLALALVARKASFSPRAYFLWLFGSVSLMNCGYLIFSGLFGSGDWAVAIDGLSPAWWWRGALVTMGAFLYATSIRMATHAPAAWVKTGDISVGALQRFVWISYFTGGALMIAASLMNPVGWQLVLVSGVGASFGLTWGLLLVPLRI